MLNGTDQVIIAFARKLLYMLPYGDLSFYGYPVGEIAWLTVIACIMGEIYLLLYKKKVVR